MVSGTTMRSKRSLWLMTVAILVVALAIPHVRPTSATHESTNALTFAVPEGPGPASGDGTVTYHGGDADSSRWTSQFHFAGLESNERYVVVVIGRFGEDGSPEAEAFTSLCSFQSDDSGAGGCWWYHIVLDRVNVVQLRSGDEAGTVVLQATRDPGGPGSITSVPNAFSPTPTPDATPDAGTPGVTPASPAPVRR